MVNLIFVAGACSSGARSNRACSTGARSNQAARRTQPVDHSIHRTAVWRLPQFRVT